MRAGNNNGNAAGRRGGRGGKTGGFSAKALIIPAVVLALCGGGYYIWDKLFPSEDLCETCHLPVAECHGHEVAAPVEPKSVAVYIDNSGSMKGYVSDKSDFIDALATLTMGVYTQTKTSVNLVDGNSGKSTAEFIQDLKDGKIKFTSSSLLHKDITNIVSTTKEGELALYVTDGIMSGESAAIAEAPKWSIDNAATLQHQVSGAFNDSINKCKFGVSIYQMMSGYTGTYYCYDNKPVNVNSPRPFYVIALGTAAVLKDFKDRVEDKKDDSSFYFKPCNAYHLIEPLPLTEGFSFEQSGAFTLLDGKKSSYCYQSSAVKGGSVVCRIDLDKVFKYQSLPDSNAVGTAARFEVLVDGKMKVPVTYDAGTNLFKFSINVNNLGPESKVCITLPYKVPGWIDASSCDDDKYMGGIMTDSRTFLFKKFVWGIKNGLAPNVSYLYSKEITLKQK